MSENQHRYSRLGRTRFNLSEDIIRYAMNNTKSARQAAAFLNISYPTFKKYAKMYTDPETGQTLFEMHKNMSGKGVPKTTQRKSKIYRLLDGEDVYMTSTHIRDAIISEAIKPECCSNCGYNERRIADGKVPLMLDWIDGDNRNNCLDNWRLLCFNCYFILVGNLIGRKSAMYELEENKSDHHVPMVDVDPSIWNRRG